MMPDVRVTVRSERRGRRGKVMPPNDGATQPVSLNTPLGRVLSRPATIPLSYAQQRVWFLDRLYGQTPQFNLVGLLPLKGEAPMPSIRFAIVAVMARHESLRTRFI